MTTEAVEQLDKVLQENSFQRQITRLQNQQEIIQENMLRVLGNRLVKFSTRHNIPLTTHLVHHALNQTQINHLEVKEWTSDLQDIATYGDKLPLVETSREWIHVLRDYAVDPVDTTTEFLQHMSRFAHFAAKELRKIVPNMGGLDLVELFEIHSPEWTTIFSNLGWSAEELSLALERMHPDLNEAIIHYYRSPKKALKLILLNPEDAKRLDQKLRVEKELLEQEEDPFSEVEVAEDSEEISSEFEEEGEPNEGDISLHSESEEEYPELASEESEFELAEPEISSDTFEETSEESSELERISVSE